ncbi:PREDICTED: protein TIFY 8 [Ipomoea nil]|uniref:protein TIFY 8 n=1 Tax=Ipomoea nil TaxID=35883 RepID=UPI000901E90E|nr:PREDICTED: protein TIFY 8 [Ipomoea nil]
MAHSRPANANTKISANAAQGLKGSAVFHDFFGKGCAAPDSSPAASASVGASSGGGRAPISTTSDLGSGPETSYRYSGSKRCNSDSIMGVSRDKFPTVRPDSLESSRAMKLLQSAGGERLMRRPYDEEASLGVHPMRPLSASLISQSSLGAKLDASTSRWDRGIPINVGPTLQYPPRASQISPYSYQAPSNRFRDGIAAGPSVMSQAAADEGSRTGIKGSGILSSINASGGMPDRALPGVPLSSCKQKSGVHISEPESSTNLSQRGAASTGRQMTIFYGGQAHVFDDVHPNKADIIMALAGSNGGSWSTTYAPKSAPRPSSIENCMPSGENEMGVGSGMSLLRELQGRSSLRAGGSHASGSGDQISLPPGIHRGSFIAKEARAAVQTPETMNEEKRDV